MSSKLIIPIGIPGCGKSTFAKLFFDQPYDDIHSTDEIRSRPEFGGDINSQENNDAVFRQFHLSIRESLQYNSRVFADATNLTRRARRELLDDAKASNCTDIHVLLFKNTHEAYVRNLTRERTVPEHAMARMLDNYERTLLDLETERELYTTITEIGSIH